MDTVVQKREVTNCCLIKSPHLVLETADIRTNSREPESGSRHATCEDPSSMLGVQFPAFQSITLPKAENESSTTPQHCRNYIPSDSATTQSIQFCSNTAGRTSMLATQTWVPHCHWKPQMLHASPLPWISPSHTLLTH
jgi:hypothetical protein